MVLAVQAVRRETGVIVGTRIRRFAQFTILGVLLTPMQNEYLLPNRDSQEVPMIASVLVNEASIPGVILLPIA